MIRLEARPNPSRAMVYGSPVIALALTLLAGLGLFGFMGRDPLEAMAIIFIEPLTTVFSVSELLVKATPLILIGLGLSVGFRAGIYNIGAEGQYAVGALAGGCVALAFYNVQGIWLLPLAAVAGITGGMAWAAIPAFLRTRFGANEILVSLMLTYVAVLWLSALVHGPLRDPDGFNFPESRLFHDSATLPILIEGTRTHIGFAVALGLVMLVWLMLGRHIAGFKVQVFGLAPRAARFAGFSERRMIWFCLLFSGAFAGLAGMFEATGPVGQLVPSLAVGYGFTGIIVAFLGRLSPVGVVLAGLVMALTYVGGEAAQIRLSLPSAVTGVFQGLLLFFLLGVDVLVTYRVVRIRRG